MFSSADTVPIKRPKRSLAANVSALASAAPSRTKGNFRSRLLERVWTLRSRHCLSSLLPRKFLMEHFTHVSAAIGGLLIGLSATLL